MKRLRPMGEVTSEMELLLQEMVDDHDLQWHEVLHLVYGWLKLHAPEAQETFTLDESHPVFYYGHRGGVK